MATSAFSMKFFCLGLLGLLVLAAAPHAEAVIGCPQVYNGLSPCLSYIGGGSLNPGCCPGIKGLLGKAGTKPDRQAICGCLKNLASSYSSSIGRAQTLLKQCGVTLPYPLDPRIDCTKVN